MKEMLRFIVILLACSKLAACSLGVELDAIEHPSYVWQADNSLCGFTRLIDANGDVWDENGCENGIRTFNRVGQLEPEEFIRIAELFKGLPLEKDVSLCEAGAQNQFAFRESVKSQTVWNVGCSSAYYSTENIPEPFLSIAKIMLMQERK